jgi:hypothetical protein
MYLVLAGYHIMRWKDPSLENRWCLDNMNNSMSNNTPILTDLQMNEK